MCRVLTVTSKTEKKMHIATALPIGRLQPMKHVISLALFFFITLGSVAQISIDRTDMPNVNDTFRYSVSDNMLGIINLNNTGANYTWDYSTLSSVTQRVDTFVDPIFGTPLIYNVTFSSIFDLDHFATLAQRNAQSTQMGFGPMQITDVYDFYRETNEFWAYVGLGATINDIPLTSTTEPRDFVYRFPMTFGDHNESFSQYGFDVPTFGHYGQKKNRVNDVDGWGVLKTRYGTFNAIRVFTTLEITDTINFNGFGFNQPRPKEFEVKWFAKGIRTPLLKVTGRMNFGQTMIMGVEYLDSLRGYTPGSLPNPSGVAEGPTPKFDLAPNPTNGVVNVNRMDSAPITLTLTDLNGRVLHTWPTMQGPNISLEIPANINNGIYVLGANELRGNKPVRLSVLR